jgi:5-hydroxyisourate hydrolase
MSAITTHVLDTSRGLPAAGVPVVLEAQSADGAWKRLGFGATNADGRVGSLVAEESALTEGVYRLVFDTRTYNPDGLYPEVTVTFQVRDAGRHYHIPLLLSPHGYTTYRGS